MFNSDVLLFTWSINGGNVCREITISSSNQLIGFMFFVAIYKICLSVYPLLQFEFWLQKLDTTWLKFLFSLSFFLLLVVVVVKVLVIITCSSISSSRSSSSIVVVVVVEVVV